MKNLLKKAKILHTSYAHAAVIEHFLSLNRFGRGHKGKKMHSFKFKNISAAIIKNFQQTWLHLQQPEWYQVASQYHFNDLKACWKYFLQGTSSQKPQKKIVRAKAILYGLSSLRRDGDVLVNVLSTHTIVKSRFLVGPLTLRVEKEVSRYIHISATLEIKVQNDR